MSEKIWRRNVLVLAQGHLSVNRNTVLGVMALVGVLFRYMLWNPASINLLLAWGLMYKTFILPHPEAS